MVTTLLIAIAITAAAYLLVLSRPQTLGLAVLKTMPVALMAVVSIVLDMPYLLTLGLAASAAGDAALAFDEHGDNPFFVGVIFFSVAHLAYAALFVSHPQPTAALAPLINGILATGMVIAGAVTQKFFWPKAGRVRVPLAIYTIIIVLMGLCALAYANTIVIAGVLCFMASDTLVGTRRFLLASDSSLQAVTGRVMWVLYIAAQALILYGFATNA